MELETQSISFLGYSVSAVLIVTFFYVLREKSLSHAARKLEEFNGPPSLPFIGTEYISVYVIMGGLAGNHYTHAK
jgi:hypothetical protein